MGQNPIVRFFVKIYLFLRAFIFTLGFLVLAALIFAALQLRSVTTPSLSYKANDKIFLHWKLDGTLLSKSPESGSIESYVRMALQGEEHELYVPKLRELLKQAKDDSQVVGLALELKSLSGALAEFSELRKALAEFKSTGKPIEFWAANVDTKTYYLASVADHIQMAPEGQVFAPGPMFQMVYGGDFFRKIGVAFEVIRAGQFKSAFEPFIANDPSAETRKAYTELEASLRQFISTDIAQGRKTGAPVVEGWLRRSMFNAREAFADKLIDELAYREAFEDSIEKKGKLVDFSDYHHREFVKNVKEKVLRNHEGIAFIEVVGEMFMEHSEMFGGSTFDFDNIEEQLQWARDDEDVRVVVLRIDSPGGSALVADLLWEDVRRLSEKKPVVVSMGAYAASGGYYMAAPATKILAQPMTITGSIGVIGLLPSFEEFRSKYGVSFHLISGTDRQSLLNQGLHISAEDKALLERHVRTSYETFVNRVASGRKKTFAEIDAVAQGRVWTGLQAKEFGLVDEIGGLPEAFRAAKQLAKFDVDKDYPVLHYEVPATRSLRRYFKKGKLMSLAFAEESMLSELPVLRSLMQLANLQKKEQVLMMLPDLGF